MAHARVCLRMNAGRLCNRPAKISAAKLKTTVVKNLRLELQNRFDGLELDENASPEDE